MLNVDLSVSAANGQGVVALDGDFDRADAPAVTSHLVAAVAACGPSVIVDLTALQSIGFAGLGVLLQIRNWSHNSGGDLPLAAPQPPVRHVLEALEVFSIYRSVAEAARGARQARPPVPAAPLPVPVQARAATMSRFVWRQPAHRRFYRPPAPPLHQAGRRRRRELTTACSRLCNYVPLYALDIGL